MPSTILVYTVITAAVLGRAGLAKAESHTIRFQNNCGKGTPQLVQAGKVLSTGSDFTSNGQLTSAIAYLQTGDCSIDGNNCALVEVNMANPQSFADLSIIPSHALNVETAFSYYGGDGLCDGLGASCADPNCDTAYHIPTDDQVVRGCNSADVNVLVTFCGGGGSKFTDASPNAQSGQQSGANSTDASSTADTGSSGSTAATITDTAGGTSNPTSTQTNVRRAAASIGTDRTSQTGPTGSISVSSDGGDDGDDGKGSIQRASAHKRALNLRNRRLVF